MVEAYAQALSDIGWRRAASVLLAPTLLPVALALLLGRGGPLFFAGYAGALVVLVAAIISARSSPLLITSGLLIWLSISRFTLSTLTALLTPTTLSVLLAWSEFFFPFLMLVFAPRIPTVWRSSSRAIRRLDILAVAFLVFVGVAMILSPTPLIDRVLYARRLGVLPIVYLAARLMPWTKGDAVRIARLVVADGVVLALFGFVEWLLPAGWLWGGIADPLAYYRMAAFSGSSGPVPILDGLPMTFWTWIGGVPVRRLVSTSLEAATVAMFFALAAVVAIGVADRRGWSPRSMAAAAIPGLACLLTLGKAGMAILAAGTLYTLLGRRFDWLTRPRILAWVAGATTVGIVGIGVVAESVGITAGVSRHLNGLVAGWDAMVQHPLGLGLGSTGVFASSQAVAESSLGVLMAQLGLPGLLLWLSWIVAAGTVCVGVAKHLVEAPAVGLAVGASLIAFMAASTLTESTGGLLWNWTFAMLAAVLVSDALARRPNSRPSFASSARDP